MLVCTDESDDPNVDVEETSEQTPHKKDKKFVFNHGGEFIVLLTLFELIGHWYRLFSVALSTIVT